MKLIRFGAAGKENQAFNWIPKNALMSLPLARIIRTISF